MTDLKKCLLLVFLLISACDSAVDEKTIVVLKEKLANDPALEETYAGFDFRPIWISGDGLTDESEALLGLLGEEISYDGLNPADYGLDALRKEVKKAVEEGGDENWAGIEMAMSHTFLRLCQDLHMGKVDPSQMGDEWKMEAKETDLDMHEILLSLGKDQGGDISEILDELRPSNPLYLGLKDALKAMMDEDAVERESFADKGAIKPGDTDESLVTLRKILAEMGDGDATSSDAPATYDEGLVKAVKHFQKRHGLREDGVLGEDFWRAMNASRQDQMVKLKVNMERLRWLPDFYGAEGPKVLVNIPNFYMDYLVDQDTVFRSRAVVGKAHHETPVFSAKMSYLVFSPNWILPQGILWSETIPKIQQDGDYLEKNRMFVSDKSGEEIDPKSISWKKLKKEEDFPYFIKQRPGDDNALGRVKFMFPNPYSIYIHDSPAKSLYSRDERAFSHGCIRIEKPAEFAAILLESEENWGKDSIASAMSREEEKQVNLKEQPMVWILYLTAWKDQGALQLREDVYGNDLKLAQLMGEKVDDSYF